MPAGRPAGSKDRIPNELRAAIIKRLEEKYPDWNPVMQMADWANDETLQFEERFAAAREVAPYLLPKLKSVELTGAGGGPFLIQQAKGDAEL